MGFSLNNNFYSCDFGTLGKNAISSFMSDATAKLTSAVSAQVTTVLKQINAMQLLLDGFGFDEALFDGYGEDDFIQIPDNVRDLCSEALETYATKFGNTFTLTAANGAWVNMWILQETVNDTIRYSLAASSQPMGEGYYFGPMHHIQFESPLWELRRNVYLSNGERIDIHDLLYQQRESLALNEAIVAIVNAAKSRASNFVATISNITQTAFSSVKNLVVDAINAFNDGGFKGVFSLIASFFSAGSTMTNDDGTLAFTNNLSYVPQQYIVGLIPAIVTTVSTVLGAIVSYFNPFIGAGIMLIGTAISGLVSSINYDASATKPGINKYSDKVYCDALPWAIHHGAFNSNTLSGDTQQWIRSLLSTGVVVLTLGPVVAFIGADTFNASGEISRLRYEVHPRYVSYDWTSSILVDRWLSQYSFTPETSATWHGSYSITLSGSLAHDLIDSFDDYAVEPAYEVDGNMRLTNASDLIFRRDLGTSVGLYLYLLLSLGSASASSVTCNMSTNWGDFKIAGTTYPSAHDWFTPDSWSTSTADNYWASLLWATSPLGVGFTDAMGYTYFIDKVPLTRFSYTLIADLFQTNVELSPQGSPGALPIGITTLGFRQFMFTEVGYTTPPSTLPSTFDYIIVPAKYDPNTFLAWLIITTVAIVGATVAITAATIKFRKWRTIKQAQNAASVENAWNRLTSNPTVENAAAYRKAAKRANLMRIFVGGPKYNASNYWGAGSDGSSAALSSMADYTNDNIAQTILDRIVGPSRT